MTQRTVLVTGATGYIGGLLVPRLLADDWQVRVLSRHPEALRGKEWADQVEVFEGSASEAQDMAGALDGMQVAYYLLHSMDGGGDFVRRDREMAHIFADAAKAAGVQRLVYLSGLHPTGDLSPHLGSRVEVGDILLASGVPTAVLQAGVVLGDGSASFDMLRHLTERLPAVVAPRWLRNRIQPVAIDDVLHYLVRSADLAQDVNRTFDIGGPDVLTYAEMMREYARVTGLGSPLIATVPVLTPQLASHWVGAVTPVSAGIARPLVGSLIHEAVCDEDDILDFVGEPPGGRMSYDDAIQAATSGFDPRGWRHRAYRIVGIVMGVAGLGMLASGLKRRYR